MDLGAIKDLKTNSLKITSKELMPESVKYLANLKENANHQNITPRGIQKSTTVQNFLATTQNDGQYSPPSAQK